MFKKSVFDKYIKKKKEKKTQINVWTLEKPNKFS